MKSLAVWMGAVVVAVLAFASHAHPNPTAAPVLDPVMSPATQSPAPSATVLERKEPVSRSTRPAGPRKLEDLPWVWQKLAFCESSYDLHAVSPSGEHHGLWQLHEGFYNVFDINPETATFSQQWKVAKYVYNRQGARAWSCADYAGLQ